MYYCNMYIDNTCAKISVWQPKIAACAQAKIIAFSCNEYTFTSVL